ncbi:sulfotransferase family protein [Hydrogenophaga soli]
MTAHPCFNLNIVSPQFPCGAAWLANALIELGVPLWELWGFDTRSEWERQGDGKYRYVAGYGPWQQTLASLQTGRLHEFDLALQPRFSHGFPWQCDLTQRTIFVVRDPRDALYSEWQRQLRNSQIAKATPFEVFLKMPFFGGPISHIDMLWLHLRSWLVWRDESPSSFKRLRFEDWKSEPKKQLTEACQWMGLRPDPAAVSQAAAASEVDHLQKVEERLLLSDPSARQFNRRGQMYEWRSAWKIEWFNAFGAHWCALFDALDYEPNPVAGQWPLCFDLDEVLVWRRLDSVTERRLLAHRLFSSSVHSNTYPAPS